MMGFLRDFVKNLNVLQRTLTDIRDSKTYQVRKLADGNIWMTQNLALGSGSGAITLHAYDSDVSSDWVLPQAQTSGNDAWGVDEDHIYATNNTTYGNYYSWHAATAGTGLSSMISATITNLTNAPLSVCPRGWRLPDGGQAPSKSWYALDIALGGDGLNRRDDTVQSNKYINWPYLFEPTGYYRPSGGVQRQGYDGDWWARSAGTSENTAYHFNLRTEGLIYPQNANPGNNGFAVRCLAK